MTRSCLATSASRALSSLTSSEIGVARLTPSESFLAVSRVRQATGGQHKDNRHPLSFLVVQSSKKPKSRVKPKIGRGYPPTVTGMPLWVNTSRVGRVTKPAPSIRTDLESIISSVSSYTKKNTHCCAILIFFVYLVMVCDDSKLKNLPRQKF